MPDLPHARRCRIRHAIAISGQAGAAGADPAFRTLARAAGGSRASVGIVAAEQAYQSQSATDVKCRDRFVREFGLHAFRRPLGDAEFQKYAKAFTTQARATGTFLEGARVVVEAMLQSPKFLFHTDAGPEGRFADYA